MDYQQAIEAYTDQFEEDPPLREMDELDAIEAIQDALENGEPLTDSPLDDELPPGAFG